MQKLNAIEDVQGGMKLQVCVGDATRVKWQELGVNALGRLGSRDLNRPATPEGLRLCSSFFNSRQWKKVNTTHMLVPFTNWRLAQGNSKVAGITIPLLRLS